MVSPPLSSAYFEKALGPVGEIGRAIGDGSQLIEPGQELDRIVDRLAALAKADTGKPSRHEEPDLQELRRHQKVGRNIDLDHGLGARRRHQSAVRMGDVAGRIVEC